MHPIQSEALDSQVFHLPFGKGMTGLAELRLEAYRFHERLIVFLPDRMSLKIPVKHDTFYAVCQDICHS